MAIDFLCHTIYPIMTQPVQSSSHLSPDYYAPVVHFITLVKMACKDLYFQHKTLINIYDITNLLASFFI